MQGVVRAGDAESIVELTLPETEGGAELDDENGSALAPVRPPRLVECMEVPAPVDLRRCLWTSLLFITGHHRTPRLPSFDHCFAGAMMSTHVDSTIEKWVSLDTRQSAECANEWVRGDCAKSINYGPLRPAFE